MPCKIDFVNDWELKYQGAESRIYFGSHSDNPCVIKHRFSKKYRHPILDKKLTKERTKRERRMIERIRGSEEELAHYMPRVLWSDDSTILMTQITDCQSVFDYIESGKAELNDTAVLIGQCVANLHNLSIMHGDLTTSNLLLVPRQTLPEGDSPKLKKPRSNSIRDTMIVVPIDFGLSTGISNNIELPAVDLFVLERALLSAHFPNSDFFATVMQSYLDRVKDVNAKTKLSEKLREVRSRGRKFEYSENQEA